MTGNGLALAGNATRTALALPQEMSYDEWEEVGRTLGDIGAAVQWWTGDWLNFGEHAYGEKYSQAVDLMKLSDDPVEAKAKYGTLSNWASVANKVPPENRDPELPWSHHRAVSSLDPPTQKVLLQEAKANSWTKAKLEQEAKARRDGTVVEEPKTEPCPACDGTGKVAPGGKGQP